MSAGSAAASSQLEVLQAKIADRSAAIVIVGMGYVGLPLALRFAACGFKVTGIDIDADKVRRLNAGESYIAHIPPADVRAALDAGFRAAAGFEPCATADAIVICVPTPLGPERQPDLQFVLGTIESLLPYLRAGQLISLESTTYPGTTDEELRTRVEARGLRAGVDAFICFSPEREDPGNPRFNTKTIPKICGGCTDACLDAGLALYRAVVDRVVPVSSTRAAEMTKLLENIHRAVNIGLVNEMKIICDRMGIDVHEVIRAAATKPFGFVPYWPGPGLGGHCIPVDPFYLTWKARQYGVHTRFIELAGEINHEMPRWVLGKLAAALKVRGKELKGSRILMLGVAYKKNVNDLRESPAIEMMVLLEELGAYVDYADPLVPAIPPLRRRNFDMRSVGLTPESLAGYDAALLATDHDAFDYRMIGEHAPLIVDTRGVYLEAQPNVVKA